MSRSTQSPQLLDLVVLLISSILSQVSLAFSDKASCFQILLSNCHHNDGFNGNDGSMGSQIVFTFHCHCLIGVISISVNGRNEYMVSSYVKGRAISVRHE